MLVLKLSVLHRDGHQVSCCFGPQALILATSSQTLEVHLQRSITVIFLSSLFFFICNILYYERRRNFMILLDLRNKNNIIDYLEQNGRVISFTVEVNVRFDMPCWSQRA